ncbi:MAG: manganese efflux pump [Bacilli bacterium]|nr:manganese efflux pump [Bacilli bacterium]
MSNIELLIVAIALSMDAFSVSICKGLTLKKISLKKSFIIALFFGTFQGLMPLTGYVLGNSFASFIAFIDHFVAFFLLNIIGINMIKDGFKNDNEINDNFHIKEIIILAIATSMDALTVGITFAFLKIDILYSIVVISIITFIICFIGVILGTLFRSNNSNKATIFGGITLCLLGLKILLEHLF